MGRESSTLAAACAAILVCATPRLAHAAACAFGYPVGDQASSPAPLFNGHPVNGNNLPSYGAHLGGDYWSGGGCTDYGQTVYAVADGEIVEIVDGLGSYLDVVVIRHDVPELGNIYSMYGHISRDDGLAEGQMVSLRQPIGFIDDVLAYFSPCHLHFELLSHEAFVGGPFCNGCENAGYSVSPGYDQQKGVTMGVAITGDPYIEVNDAVTDNRWYFTDEFIDARLNASCGTCGDGTCDTGETFASCPDDCDPCAWIPPTGITLDESGACFTEFGPGEYWFYETVGHAGSLQYTHTTDSQAIDNYGVWELVFEQAGEYQIEVYAEPGWGQSVQAGYTITHSGVTDEVVVDQSTGGFLDLGTFMFDAGGGGQQVRLDDNTGEPWDNKIQLVFDAVRITPVNVGGTSGGSSGETSGTTSASTGAATSSTSGASTTDTDTMTSGSALPPASGQDTGEDGCACRSTPSPRLAWLLPVLLGLRTRRKRDVVPWRR